MGTQTVLCKNCNAPLLIKPEQGKETSITCSTCKQELLYSPIQEEFEEIQFYGLQEPFSFASIIKNTVTLKKTYHLLEPVLSDSENEALEFLRKAILETLTINFEELDTDPKKYLIKEIDTVISYNQIKIEALVRKKLLYYLLRWFIGFDFIDALMRDPYIEDISCDGAQTPVFVHHRDFGSLETNLVFNDEKTLSRFVVRLAQKCGKHISVATPMLDATMPDGSRIQMTLSSEITTKGSTFTIRRFKADPITPIDLIGYNTMSSEILAYLWMAVQHGANALISGGTASGKTSTLNAIALFIPRESKIVSIEETREINLPHPNWIPGVSRTGLGEVLHNQSLGEIDLYDLMKAALRQRPEFILVGEIRGKEAYVLFQAMATGHTTYSTVHADSMSSLIHRLEGKPINIPRLMLQSLNLVLLQGIVKTKESHTRRCKEIVEVITVDSETKEVLTNSVFKWDSVQDSFKFSGKSFMLEKLREQLDLSHEEMKQEIKNRELILEWLKEYNLREFRSVADMVSSYTEKPEETMEIIKHPPSQKKMDARKSTLLTEISETNIYDTPEQEDEETLEKKGFFGFTKKKILQRN